MLIAIAVWLLVSVSASPALARAPRLLRYDVSRKFSVRPATMFFGCCGQFIIGGPMTSSQDVQNGNLGHINWTQWNVSAALGMGTVLIDNCTPDCAHGTYVPHPASIRGSRVRHGRYTRLRLIYRYQGRKRTDTRSLQELYNPDVFIWS